MNTVARDVLINTGYSYPKKRVHVIHNGVDTERFKFDLALREKCRREIGVTSDAVAVVLYCGRLSPEKGPDVLLEAWGSLSCLERENLRLLVVGDGPMAGELQSEVNRRGTQDTVKFVGFQEDVLRYLCACDIFVLPSRSESFGLSLAEAMAVARYAIATRVGGVPELLSNPRVGKLIDPESPEQLAGAISAAAQDPSLRQRVGAQAQEHIREYFSLERMVAQTIDVILGERP